MENSRFKFRAWDKKNNVMIYGYDTQTNTYPYDGWQEHPLCAINCLLSGTLNDYLGMDLVFMQYTGSKDKNDVEIYDGDIVKCIDTYDEFQTIQVVFDIEVCGFYPMCGSYTDFPFSNFEIVGNIYENPTLLNP